MEGGTEAFFSRCQIDCNFPELICLHHVCFEAGLHFRLDGFPDGNIFFEIQVDEPERIEFLAKISSWFGWQFKPRRGRITITFDDVIIVPFKEPEIRPAQN